MVDSKLLIIPLLMSLMACDGGDSEVAVDDVSSLELIFTDPGARSSGVAGVKFVEDIMYGAHDNQRFDIHMPSSNEATPLLLFFHGGGFTGGDEDRLYGKLADDFPTLLEHGYAVATATYQLLDETHSDGVIRSLTDTKYALQFMRYHAQALNIDPENIVLMGTSAGAASSLWIGLQDDMADTQAQDPVLHESTRVKAIVAVSTQATLDTSRWNSEIFEVYNISDEESIILGGGAQNALRFYGVAADAAALADPLAALATPEIEAYQQSIDMLDFITSDDPELWVSNLGHYERPVDSGAYYHHSHHARAIYTVANTASVPGVYYYDLPDGSRYTDPTGETNIEFILRKLAE
jgi:para-nitrobenzyl esterase